MQRCEALQNDKCQSGIRCQYQGEQFECNLPPGKSTILKGLQTSDADKEAARKLLRMLVGAAALIIFGCVVTLAVCGTIKLMQLMFE